MNSSITNNEKVIIEENRAEYLKIGRNGRYYNPIAFKEAMKNISSNDIPHIEVDDIREHLKKEANKTVEIVYVKIPDDKKNRKHIGRKRKKKIKKQLQKLLMTLER